MRLLVIGGSDAGISAALRARECDPSVDVQLLVADAYPNFSICGIPYHVSGEVPEWHDLAHRTTETIENAGVTVRLNERALSIDAERRLVTTTEETLAYDKLVIATGAVPSLPPIGGLDQLGPADGVHVLHSMDDTFMLTEGLAGVRQVAIVGGGYIGLEMAEALTARGVQVTLLEAAEHVLPRTLDHELASLVEAELARHGVEVACASPVGSIRRVGERLELSDVEDARWTADLVLVAGGVRPAVRLAAAAGVELSSSRAGSGAIAVDNQMRTNVPNIYAAGDCVHTHHALLPDTAYLPLGTTAHKQGRVAGENAVGGDRRFRGSVGTQVVRVFDRVVAATGLRDHEAAAAGFSARTTRTSAHDHKSYYPGATLIHARITGEKMTGRLLGAQLVGHLGAEVAKRVDVFAAAIQHGLTLDDLLDLDLSYTPPFGSPWDAVQLAAMEWVTFT